MTGIWLHGASAGDMRALAPLITGIEDGYPGLEIHVTAWTQSGLAMGQKLYPTLSRGRPPIPLRWTAKRFLRQHKIGLVLLEYLELYPGWIDACHDLNIPIMVVDGRITKRSLRIKWILNRSVKRLAAFCAQTETDARHARMLGVPEEQIFITGNGKFDGQPMEAKSAFQPGERPYGHPDVVIGSLHADEEKGAIDAINGAGIRALIAPRYLKRVVPIIRRARAVGISVSRHSLGQEPAQIHILDTYGDLADAYGHAPVNIIGGTFGRRGGQNLFEAALHNNIVIYGPNTENVSLEVDALSGHGAYRAGSWREAVSFVGRQLPPSRLHLAVLQLMGTTTTHLSIIARFIASELNGVPIGFQP